ncbi:hypothetical protein FIBSPDRAFT_892339 [Athelia psychrophila]|uniref:Uncharacterized protein n=1 Tax=Athelia psychrophila TaxID=1759441 RepID=A0A166ILG1_9AGAM|nr:hypothetical protein FIBSPDRAFT_892339 [Fibularhizoctonia sp. CBS 109695]
MSRALTGPCEVEYSLTSFLASIPSMRASLRLSLLYETWQREVESRAMRRLPSEMRREMHTEKRWCKRSMCSYLQLMPGAEGPLKAHELEGDAGVGGCQCVHPHSRHSSWEADAIDSTCRTSVLRSDAQNADKYYRLKYDAALRSPARKEDVEAQKSFKFVDENFAPMYFIRTYPSDTRQAASRDENDPAEVTSQKRRKAEPSVVALCGDGALYDAHQWKEAYAVRGVWDDFESNAIPGGGVRYRHIILEFFEPSRRVSAPERSTLRRMDVQIFLAWHPFPRRLFPLARLSIALCLRHLGIPLYLRVISGEK